MTCARLDERGSTRGSFLSFSRISHGSAWYWMIAARALYSSCRPWKTASRGHSLALSSIKRSTEAHQAWMWAKYLYILHHCTRSPLVIDFSAEWSLLDLAFICELKNLWILFVPVMNEHSELLLKSDRVDSSQVKSNESCSSHHEYTRLTTAISLFLFGKIVWRNCRIYKESMKLVTLYNSLNSLILGTFLCILSLRLIWCVKVVEEHVSGLQIVPCGEPWLD